MQGGLRSHRPHRLRLQIRATQVRRLAAAGTDVRVPHCQAAWFDLQPSHAGRQRQSSAGGRSSRSTAAQPAHGMHSRMTVPPTTPFAWVCLPAISLQCQAPPGRTYWSEGVELDAMGGAAVVAVPSPLLPPTAAIPAARASYQISGLCRQGWNLKVAASRWHVNAERTCWNGLQQWDRPCRTSPTSSQRPLILRATSTAVTASQVPGSSGALALYLLPRFLLINALDVPIQYKQQVRAVPCDRGPACRR